MKIYLKTLIWIIIFGLSGCQNGNKAKHSFDRLNSTKWIFLGLQHNETKIYEPVPSDISVMNIAFNNSHSFQANSSCNTAYGYYSVFEQNSIKIDSIVMTKMTLSPAGWHEPGDEEWKILTDLKASGSQGQTRILLSGQWLWISRDILNCTLPRSMM